MVPGARLCENGRFYRDGARAPHTSAGNIDIGGAGVAISTQSGLWSLFSHATDPSSVVGMDIRGAGGSRFPSLASAKWSLFSHAMEWKTHEQSLQDIGGAGGYSQRRPSDGRYFRAQRTLHPSSALGAQPSPWPSPPSSTPWQITVIMRGPSQPVRESVHNYDLRGGLAPPGALPLLRSRITPQIPLITWGP